MRLLFPRGCAGAGLEEGRALPALRLLLLVAAMALYLGMGASVFSAIEGPQEELLQARVDNVKEHFLHEHRCISDTKPCTIEAVRYSGFNGPTEIVAKTIGVFV